MSASLLCARSFQCGLARAKWHSMIPVGIMALEHGRQMCRKRPAGPADMNAAKGRAAHQRMHWGRSSMRK